MKQKISKKAGYTIAAIGMVVIITVSLCFFLQQQKNEEKSTVTKETTVKKGDITTGVSESGSITVGTKDQTVDSDFSVSSTNASSDSSENTSSVTQMSSVSDGGVSQSRNTAASQQSDSQQSASTSSSSTSSVSSAGALEVEEVYVAVGQEISEKDKILKLTDASVTEVRKNLKEAVSDATLALSSAQVSDEQTKLNAQSEYDSNIAAGKVAKSVYNAVIQSIEANLVSLKSQIKNCSDSKEKASLKAQLEEAENKEASQKLEAKQTYEETMLNYNNAKSIYDVAMAEVGTKTKEAEETLEEAKETLADFEEFVGTDNIIYAKESGIVVAEDYTVGDTISSDINIVSVADKENVTVSVDVTQDDIGVVNRNDIVKVSFISDEENSYEGVVTEIKSAVTSGSTVSYPVTILLSSMPDTVLTGMTATVTFVTEEVKNVVYVSNKAIINENGVSYVLRQKEDKTTQKTKVTTGFSNGINVEIKDGLSEGDTVFIESKVSD